MSDFSHAEIIFNPNSTGDSPTMAKDFARELKRSFPGVDVRLRETKRPGHGGELAKEAAERFGADCLIISVSGDGGYHEVVNGVMSSGKRGDDLPYCAVLPGGNANDHYSSVYDRPLIEALREGSERRLDLLHVTSGNHEQYAHSYVGLGITPLVAIELNKHDLAAFREIWLALKTFWRFRPFTIEMGGEKRKFDSLIMGNIDTMAKHLTLDEESDPRDGKFEVIRWPHATKPQLLLSLLRAALSKPPEHSHVDRLAFRTLKPMPMQLDGEIVELEADTDVEVTVRREALRTFI